MSNICTAFNVKNEKELTDLIESFDLNENDEAELYSYLNESMSVDGIRYIASELTKKYDNGSYEKLQEQLAKEPFKRVLKEDNEIDNKRIEDKWKDIVQLYKELGYASSEDLEDEEFTEMRCNITTFFKYVYRRFVKFNPFLATRADVVYSKIEDIYVAAFANEYQNSTNNYFGQYSSYEDMYENASPDEMFEALSSSEKKEAIERAVDMAQDFVIEFEGKLFNSLLDDPENVKQPTDSGDDWLEEAANEKETKFKRINNLMKEVNRCLMDCRDGKIFEEIANNEDDSEDDLLDEIGAHMCNLLLRLSEAHYVPAELEIMDINPYIKKQAEELMNWEEWLDENIQSENDFKDWLNNNLQEKRYYGIFQALPIDGKFNCCQVIYKSMKLMYNTFINSDYYSELTAQPPKESGEEFMESYDVNKEPIFDIGDNVSFKWGDKEITGRVINTKKIGSNEYFDIISWNNEKKRRETYTTVCPVSNEMKKISEGEI